MVTTLCFYQYPIPVILKTLATTSYALLIYYVLHVVSPRINEAKYCIFSPLSSTGSILSNTDLSDLSTVGTCDILVTKCVTESCDSPDWLIQYCLSSASSRVTETVSMKMPCRECFQKCFSANNMISLWLNTVIPIIVMIWLPNMTRYLQ